MRILHILDHSLPLHSGYTFRTANLVRAQQRLGWHTYHMTGPRQVDCEAAQETIEDLCFYRTPAPPALPRRLMMLRALLEMRATEQRLSELATQLRPDILHAHSPVLNVLPALRVSHRLRIPIVYEVRAFWEDAAVDHGTTHEGSLRYRASRALETLALQRVDHVFTICAGLQREMSGRGIPLTKTTIVPNGVDISAFQLSRQSNPELRRQLGLVGATVLGFVGSFYAYEGLDLLIDALPRILGARDDVRLLLVGGGPQQSNLLKQAQRNGVADRVILPGRIPHAEVSRYYDLIDLLVYPRRSVRLTELVTPLKPLEAMAQGRILIASDIGGHRELIRDGETGRLFPPDDAAELALAALRMLEDRHLWPIMARAGRHYVERERTWQSSVERYRQPYARLVAASKTRDGRAHARRNETR